jgi:hypothetical protein
MCECAFIDKSIPTSYSPTDPKFLSLAIKRTERIQTIPHPKNKAQQAARENATHQFDKQSLTTGKRA